MDPADQAPELSVPDSYRPGANGTALGAPSDGAVASPEQPEQRSFISVIIHSFFIIPFLIAIFAGLLVVTWRILTNEPHSVYDYVADVKVGASWTRWWACSRFPSTTIRAYANTSRWPWRAPATRNS